MSHLKEQAQAILHSGEPGTTGREPFEDSSATGPGAKFASGTGAHSHSGEHGLGATGADGAGLTGGQGGLTGEHHGHHHGSHGAHAHGAGVGSGVGVGSESSGLGGVGDHQRFGQTGNTGIDEATAGSGHRGAASGATGTGIAAAVADRAGSGHHEGHHHSHQGEHGLTGQHGQDSGDRVGALGQQSANYDRTGPSGPTTSGAAGTDRFDTDKSTTTGTGVGSHGTSGLNTDSSRDFHKGENDVDRRGEGKETGGVLGALGTTDKDFTARDRTGAGAYHDDNAAFKGNTSGPGGNTALTGREGTQENNPVAQAKSRAGEDVNDVHGATGERVGSTAHPAQHDKGLMEKIKDHLPV